MRKSRLRALLASLLAASLAWPAVAAAQTLSRADRELYATVERLLAEA